MFYFSQLILPKYLNPQKSLHNSCDLLKFRSLGKTKTGRLQCLHSDSLVTFWNLVRDQYGITHWAEVGDANMADFNFTSFTLATIFKVGCQIWIGIILSPMPKRH